MCGIVGILKDINTCIPAGRMPMVYQDRYWITYNGEVYNFVEVRTELERLGHTFRSTSDTEVILASYAQWGTDCFQRFRGMCGLILFDMMRNMEQGIKRFCTFSHFYCFSHIFIPPT